MPPLPIFSFTFTVPKSAIDEYGHVNNVIYVQWMQDAATRHPQAIPEFIQPENTGWFAREHRIEYLLPAFEGDELEVRTWIADMKRVRAQRKYDFTRKSDSKVVAKGETHWVYVDLTTGRPIPIPDEMVILFPITTG